MYETREERTAFLKCSLVGYWVQKINKYVCNMDNRKDLGRNFQVNGREMTKAKTQAKMKTGCSGECADIFHI